MKLYEQIMIYQVLKKANLDEKYVDLEVVSVEKVGNLKYIVHTCDKNNFPAYAIKIEFTEKSTKVTTSAYHGTTAKVYEIPECYSGGLVRRMPKYSNTRRFK